MLDIEKLNNDMCARFLNSTEEDLVEQVLECKTHTQYLKVVETYGLETLEKFFTAEYATYVSNDTIFKNLKPLQIDTDFI